MPEEKICPKCPGKIVMAAARYVLAIPAAQPFGMAPKAINEQTVYPVGAYACPECHFVELYYVDMTS
jgi:ssDNA-binding Zn-finger/Zn-ribbon topoisomerase 1